MPSSRSTLRSCGCFPDESIVSVPRCYNTQCRPVRGEVKSAAGRSLAPSSSAMVHVRPRFHVSGETVNANYRTNTRFPDLFRRLAENPILAAADWPYLVNSVFNAGATGVTDGSTLLLARVEDRTGISH